MKKMYNGPPLNVENEHWYAMLITERSEAIKKLMTCDETEAKEIRKKYDEKLDMYRFSRENPRESFTLPTPDEIEDEIKKEM